MTPGPSQNVIAKSKSVRDEMIVLPPAFFLVLPFRPTLNPY